MKNITLILATLIITLWVKIISIVWMKIISLSIVVNGIEMPIAIILPLSSICLLGIVLITKKAFLKTTTT